MRIAPLVAAALAAWLAALAAPAAGARAAGSPITVRFLPAPSVTAGLPAVIPIRVANGWSGRATGVSLEVSAPSWVALSGRRCSVRRSRLQCALPDLAAGSAVTVRIRARSSRHTTYHISALATVTGITSPSVSEQRTLTGSPPFAAR